MVSGELEPNPFDGLDVWSLLRARSAAHPERGFVQWVGDDGAQRSWTYGEFERDARRVAVGLHRRGIGRGDPFLIHLENCPEFLLTWFACAAVGATAVTTNPRSVGDEIAYFAQHSGAVAGLTQPRLADLVAARAPSLRWLAVTEDDPVLAEGSGAHPDRASSFGALLGVESEFVDREPESMLPMNVLYTSGTTSRPKGVQWTHANSLWGGRVSATHEGLNADDIHLVYLPLFHINGMCCQVLASLWAGSKIVLITKWSTSRFWDLCHQYKCTWVPLVPFTVAALRGMEDHRGHTVRAMSARAHYVDIEERFGVRHLGWYAMTETVTHVIHTDPLMTTTPDTIGRAAVEYRVRIARPDGSQVAVGEAGEVLVAGRRGVSLFDRYLGDDTATAEAFDEHGWLHTGDVVLQEPDGIIRFIERAKDIIKVGGENVAPAEVEMVISEDRNVLEVAVVASPHPMLDEVPVAFVVTRGESADLESRILADCRERLAAFKVPRAVVIVDELPKTTIGKVQKALLREAAKEVIGPRGRPDSRDGLGLKSRSGGLGLDQYASEH